MADYSYISAGYILSRQGFKYPDTRGKGRVDKISIAAKVYAEAVIVIQFMGITVGRRSEVFFLGNLYDWTTVSSKTTHTVVRSQKIESISNDIFVGSEEPLGGKVETLG